MKKPTPTQTESPYGFDELFFSTTDSRGVITFGNDVFIRVSGYDKETMVGAPHSIIRHPDMPRAVFKLLWDTIKAGSPIAAYVKNLASNGSYYWVFAFVFPIDNGYISIRLKPSSELFKAAQKLYPLTLEVEEKGGMEASIPFLIENIQKSGFKDYQEFMIQAAFLELSALQEKKPSRGVERVSGVIGEITELSFRSSQDLKESFKRIQSFRETNQNFLKTMKELTDGFQHLKFIALNMTVAAAKFGELALSLGVIAKEFSGLSEQIRSHLTILSDFVDLLSGVVQKCALVIVALESQMLMVEFFIKESIDKIQDSEHAFDDMINNKAHFSKLFHDYSISLGNEVSGLEKHLSAISENMSEVQKFTTGLEVIRQIGAVESARVNEVRQVFVHYLEEMLKFISLLRTTSKSIEKEVLDLQEGSEVLKATSVSIYTSVDKIFYLAANFSVKEKQGG